MKKAIASLLVGLMVIGGVSSVAKAETSSMNGVENKVIVVKDNTQEESIKKIVIVKDNTPKEESLKRIVISGICAWLLSVVTLTGSLWGWLIGFANDDSVKGLTIGSVIGFVAFGVLVAVKSAS